MATGEKETKKILFITSTRIGDAVLSMGILKHLIKENPDAKIMVACGAVSAPLFAAVPNVVKIIPMEKKKFSWHWVELWLNCVRSHWDIIVDLRRSGVPYSLSAKKRYRSKKTKELIHKVKQNADILGLEKPPAPYIWLADEHRNGAKKRFNNTKTIIGIGPAANWRAKTWRIENFIELVKRLTTMDGIFPNASVAVFGAMHERNQALPLIKALPDGQCIDLVGSTGLLSTCACLERCSFFIGNDSGLMHMAAAMGVPTLGLFGPSRDELYAPWGHQTAFVRTKVPFDEIYPPDFDHRNSDTLMDTLTVDMAEEAALKLWNKLHKKSAALATASVGMPSTEPL